MEADDQGSSAAEAVEPGGGMQSDSLCWFEPSGEEEGPYCVEVGENAAGEGGGLGGIYTV